MSTTSTTSTMTIETVLTIEALTCGKCGVVFGMTSTFKESRKNDHQTWYCPNGCQRAFNGKSNAEKLADEVAQMRRYNANANAALTSVRDQLNASERSRASLKGHLTRARNKVAAGNCPAPDCGQHFANVREHMKYRHPDFHMIDPETGKAAVL